MFLKQYEETDLIVVGKNSGLCLCDHNVLSEVWD